MLVQDQNWGQVVETMDGKARCKRASKEGTCNRARDPGNALLVAMKALHDESGRQASLCGKRDRQDGRSQTQDEEDAENSSQG